MLIERRSALTGITHQQELAVTEAQLLAWRNGMLAQDAFPDLSSSEREFLITGITEEEWTANFEERSDA
jgi:hypothetical protein